ncbi:MAG: SAM hydroxide adenosyltransferase [Burkholderiales bacterium]
MEEIDSARGRARWRPGRQAQRGEDPCNHGRGDLAEVIYVDHYGDCFTGIRARGLPQTNRLAVGGREIPHARVFAEAEPGTAFWYENSSGLVEIAVNRGSAARELALAAGMPVAWAA